MSLIEELHNYNDGYVHGNLRDMNLFVEDNQDFMLLDFDWAGPIEKACYPMYVNRKDIQCPDDACDGKKIDTVWLSMMLEIKQLFWQSDLVQKVG